MPSYSTKNTLVRNTLTCTGTIARVHAARHTVDVVADRDDAYLADIALVSKYITSRGAGSYVLPEVGDRVLLVQASDADRWRVLGFVDEDEQVDDGDDGPSEGPDHRSGRPVMGRGDHVVAMSSGGGHVIVRKNGVVEVGSSPAAKRILIPLGNVIRDIAEDYELHTSAGVLSLTNSRDLDAPEEAEKTPTLLQLQVRQYAEEVPKVRLDAGYIEDAQQRRLPGEARYGQVVWRLLVGDTDDERGGGLDGFSPNYEEMIGTDGTARVRTDGSQVFDVDRTFVISAGGFELYAGGEQKRIAGGSSVAVEGAETRSVKKAAKYSFGADVTRTHAGALTESVDGHVTRRAGSEERVQGGALVERVGGDRVDTVADNRVLSVGKGQVAAFGENWDLAVRNQSSAQIGARIQVQQGELVLRNNLGDISLSAGGQSQAPTSSLDLKAAAAMELAWASSIAKMKGSASGEWFVKNAAAMVKLTIDGTVHVGTAGPAGYVLTTLTHPVHFIPAPGPPGTMVSQPTLGAGGMAVGGAPRPSTAGPAVITPAE